MSGTKKDRESLKNRFKKGMYPTEDDFADVFESYVHKDDTIKMSQVVLEEGGESVGEVIDKKADKKTLDAFIEEVDTVLETVRDAETGEITKTVIQDLSKRIKDAEDDIAETSNTAEKNENAIAKILSILGKQDGETVSELAEKFTALSGDYATVYAFISKVKAFLESADVADTTINRWQEIENFLQGITDTETLTGLLENLKTEIKNEIPKGNFLEQVADLDGYTDAEDGKIVQYIGQTNEQYERGHFYERKGGENETVLQLSYSSFGNRPNNKTITVKEVTDKVDVVYDYTWFRPEPLEVGKHIAKKDKYNFTVYTVSALSPYGSDPDKYMVDLQETNDRGTYQKNSGEKLRVFQDADGQLFAVREYEENYWQAVILNEDGSDIVEFAGINNPTLTTATQDTPASWQHIPVSPVIF